MWEMIICKWWWHTTRVDKPCDTGCDTERECVQHVREINSPRWQFWIVNDGFVNQTTPSLVARRVRNQTGCAIHVRRASCIAMIYRTRHWLIGGWAATKIVSHSPVAKRRHAHTHTIAAIQHTERYFPAKSQFKFPTILVMIFLAFSIKIFN